MAVDPSPWPAEPTSSADALFADGRDSIFGQRDWSGAHWNPDTETLWICRDTGEIRAYKRDGSNWSLEALFNRGTGIDAEAITQRNFEDKKIFVLDESGPEIREYETSGSATTRVWRIPSQVPVRGGLEGMVFVPDANLSQAGFVDGLGQPYPRSRFEFGGLLFLSAQADSQRDGVILVIDIDPDPDSIINFKHVGTYKTPLKDPRGLEFDRSSNVLYAIDDSGEVAAVRLTSSASAEGRLLDVVLHTVGPGSNALEGIALPQKGNGETWLILLNDENDSNQAVVRYNDFELVD
jgi:hypothetical protein